MDTQKLESLLDIDQNAIKDFRRGKITLDQFRSIVAKNSQYVAETIEKFGFPWKDKTSEKAYMAAFLMVLHSGNIPLIEKTVEAFKIAGANHIEKKHIAYLIDKVRVMQDSPQVYGTQYKIGDNNNIIFLPIEDVANVDKRRSEMGMDTLEKYKVFAESNLKIS